MSISRVQLSCASTAREMRVSAAVTIAARMREIRAVSEGTTSRCHQLVDDLAETEPEAAVAVNEPDLRPERIRLEDCSLVAFVSGARAAR